MADKPIQPWQKDIRTMPDFTRTAEDSGPEQKWVVKPKIECAHCHKPERIILETPCPPLPTGVDRDVIRPPTKPFWRTMIFPKNWAQILIQPSMYYPNAVINMLNAGKSPENAFGEYEIKYLRKYVEWCCDSDKCAYRIFGVQLGEARIITESLDGKMPFDVKWDNFKFHVGLAVRSLR